jgi:hypothetical protein
MSRTPTRRTATRPPCCVRRWSRNQQLWSKPADYALANPRIAELHDALRQSAAQPKIPAALTAVLQTGGMPTPDAGPSDEDRRRAATEAYANAALAEQTRLGLPEDRRQVLPKAMAQELVARILDGDTQAAADTLRDLIATWGDAAPMALVDLSRHGLPGEYRLLASLSNPAARQTFAKVLTAQTTDPGALRGKAGEEEAKGIEDVLIDALGGGQSSNFHLGAATNRFSRGDVNRLPSISGRQPRPRGSLRINPQDFVPPEDNPARSPSTIAAPKAVPLFDDDGDPVMVWNPKYRQDEQVQIPEDISLNYFAKVGEEDRNRSWGEQKARLLNFLWGQKWDLQRPGLVKDSAGKYINFPQFVDVATIAIGVYAGAAGISLDKLLADQSVAARYGSYGTAFADPEYGPLPHRNVLNTELGYYLYTSGKIKPK